jgi:NADH-quinone oxidoreductase E subunit
MESEFSPILKRYPGGRRENLIPILQEIQDSRGYIPESAISEVARYLEMPAVKIYSVATFYNEFRFDPGGRFHIQACQGIGCQVDGSERVRKEVHRLLGLNPGETSDDGMFSLEWVPCLGVCQEAPVISVNGKLYPKMTASKVKVLIDHIKNPAEP